MTSYPELCEDERATAPIRSRVATAPPAGAGTILGPYRLLAELGSGGMATVYLAELATDPDHTDLGFGEHRLAVKVLHEHLARERTQVEAFLDEGRIGQRLHHPAVCQVVDHGEDRGRPYVAMEIIDGVSLERLQTTLGEQPALLTDPMWPRQIAALVAELADGLHAAHELVDEQGWPLGLVHRDVTPENLYVTTSGGACLADFGVARHRGRPHHTREGVIKGKLAYAAPELFHGATPDRRIDLWSLGVVLWELITGRLLFRLPSDAEITHAILARPIAPPSLWNTAVPRQLDLLVLQALARDPDRRFDNASALAFALRSWLRGSGVLPAREHRRDWLLGLARSVTRVGEPPPGR